MRGYFFFYKRTLKSGKKVYYYQTYKRDGTLSSGKSTGCRTKSAAIHYCETLLIQGRIWCYHSLRHFYNTYLLSNNISPIKVAAVLGHLTGVSSVQERYTKFTEADYKEIYEVQGVLFNELKFW